LLLLVFICRVLKKLTAIFLILFTCWYVFGYILQTRIQLHALKQEMREAIDRGNFHPNKVQHLIFDASDFENGMTPFEKENDHEINFKGEMYDVVKVEMKAGKLIIDCLPDTDETQMLIAFAEQIHRQNSAGNHAKGMATLKISFGAFGMATLAEIPNKALSISISYHPLIHQQLSKVFHSVPAPPPWMA
jgi:hypothetical protein